MSTPFKMKGSPMKRNFGIGNSPMKNVDEKKKKTDTKKTSKHGSDKELIEKGFKKDELGRWRNKAGDTPADIRNRKLAEEGGYGVGGTYGTQRKMVIPVSKD